MTEDKKSKSARNGKRAHVAICICTYQRPDKLERLLVHLCSQTFKNVPPPVISIIVTDNECSDTNRAICEKAAQLCEHTLLYLQETQRGISYARNTCLENLPHDSDFVAMIDDDEIPDPGWLNHLLYAQKRTSADIVTGPTLPSFESHTPAWIIDSGYFDKPHHPGSYQDLEEFPPTATCNVLIRSDIFTKAGRRFDPALALSGSEDKLFFQDLKQHGMKFVWATGAIVVETVPSHRATLGYMLSEALRRGSTKFYVKSRLKATSPAKVLKLAFRSILRGTYGIITNSATAVFYAARGRSQRHQLVLSILEITENIGFLSGVFGYRKKHY